MISEQQVVSIVKIKGPILPSQLARELGTDSIMAAAMLSEQVSNSVLKISHVKVGSSPLYYAPVQEAKLQNYASNLHEKERKALEMLRQKKILQDKKQEPVIRVALRNIKDFAKPIEVTTGQQKEIFWKWYLLSNDETEKLVKSILKIPIKKEAPIPQPKKPEIPNQEPKKPALPKPTQQKQPIHPRIIEVPKKEAPKEEQKQLVKEPPKPQQQDDFLGQVMMYCKKNNITVLEHKVVRKKSDVEMKVLVPSSVGKLTYFCKAKNKKRINDGDLSSAFIQGQMNKLPILFITTGTLTKKAKEMLDSEFKNLTIKNI